MHASSASMLASLSGPTTCFDRAARSTAPVRRHVVIESTAHARLRRAVSHCAHQGGHVHEAGLLTAWPAVYIGPGNPRRVERCGAAVEVAGPAKVMGECDTLTVPSWQRAGAACSGCVCRRDTSTSVGLQVQPAEGCVRTCIADRDDRQRALVTGPHGGPCRWSRASAGAVRCRPS